MQGGLILDTHKVQGGLILDTHKVQGGLILDTQELIQLILGNLDHVRREVVTFDAADV